MPSPTPIAGLQGVCLGLVAFAAAVPPGCASLEGPKLSPGAKLEAAGLEVLSDEEAALREDERDRCLPCRVRPGRSRPPVPPDPAGYLIVGVDRSPASRAEILAAIEDWEPGRDLLLTIRRNERLSADTGWYEVVVPLRWGRGDGTK